MHPVKARGAIGEAWERHGVRDFVLDTPDELAKIRKETAATGVARDLGLIVRLALPKGGAVLDLSGKFGAAPDEAAALLRAARPHAAPLGVSFHGTGCILTSCTPRRGKRSNATRICQPLPALSCSAPTSTLTLSATGTLWRVFFQPMHAPAMPMPSR